MTAMAINRARRAPGRTRLVLSVHFGADGVAGGELPGRFCIRAEKLLVGRNTRSGMRLTLSGNVGAQRRNSVCPIKRLRGRVFLGRG